MSKPRKPIMVETFVPGNASVPHGKVHQPKIPIYTGENGSFRLVELGSNDPLAFSASMMKAPVVTAGYGGWSRVARPRRKAITEWAGRDSLSVTIEFILDTFDAREFDYIVERQCRNLEKMAGVQAGDPEPPLLRLQSSPKKLMPYGAKRASKVKWFIESLIWDPDMTIYTTNGDRSRAKGTLVVTQFVNDERLHPVDKKKASSGGKTRDKYTVKKGDTLQKIAAREDVYGDRKMWKVIAKANSIRDPKKIKVGQVLKIPKVKMVAKWEGGYGVPE